MAGDDELSTARMLRDAIRELIVAHSAFDEAKRPCGALLSAPHAWALLELFLNHEMTISALADRLRIDRSNVSRLCQQMESAGEVKRIPHPEDRRARLIKLTTKGENLASAIDSSSAQHFALLLRVTDLNKNVATETLTETLQVLAKTMRGYEESNR